MGNYRFRLSDMMPNALLYKLKGMAISKNNHDNTTSATISHSSGHKQTVIARGTAPVAAVSAPAVSQPSKTNQTPHPSSSPRKSYHFTRELKLTDSYFPDPPRRSSKRRQLKRRAAVQRSAFHTVIVSSASCGSRATLYTKSSGSLPDYSASSSSDNSPDESSGPFEDESFQPEVRSDRILPTESFDKMVDWSCSCPRELVSDDTDDDIIIDVGKKSIDNKFNKLDISDLDLPPIVTKKEITKEKANYRKNPPAKNQEKNSKKEYKSNGSVARNTFHSPGLKLGVKSPRIGRSRRSQGSRKSVSWNPSSSLRRSPLSNSVAIVRSSLDPQKDFKESMAEMIAENNIWASKDLENLLACYLQLNYDEYHDLIIKVFKQVLFDLPETMSK